ncbi:TolC family protein [Candidatus Nitrospira allomarina]|uniref:TolC family protein n=1 Tax=Candidatus Nitrospira allomarina TaxID=3020900 RepID=A0AA96G9T1_9BACT|nr:TolC family protein [Candidatus Nitrospira allomarina]WNM57546.1 TolC family protein [Candidatus Nitrospira allomarina]
MLEIRLFAKVCIIMGLLGVLGLGTVGNATAGEQENRPASRKSVVQRLSLDDAIALFLRQNLDLLTTQYGIDTAKAKRITAGLFPNPQFSINTLSSYTQNCQLSDCGAISSVLSQLFVVAGKRGFRIESAEFGTQSAEAGFEDSLRQLSFAVKDAYYRVQVARRHLAFDKETREHLSGVVKKMMDESQRIGYGKDLIRLKIQLVDAQYGLIRDLQQIDSDTADLLLLLSLPPETELDLTTDLTFLPIAPDIHALKSQIENTRPDVRAKRLLYAKRRAELKLALAIQYPDVTVDLGFMVQGAKGPDNQQQWTFNVGMPLPVFDRNQGGIQEAATVVQIAEADLRQTLNEAHAQVDLAYRHLVQSRRLVEAYRAKALHAAQSLFDTVKKSYESGDTAILSFLDAHLTRNDIQEAYLDALYHYQRHILLLESAAGQTIS